MWERGGDNEQQGQVKVRFSEQHGITINEAEDDWFDPLLMTDTRLYVDPFLVWADKEDHWVGAHDHLLKFFAMVLAFIREAKGNEQSPAWAKARSLLLFPEPWEFCLGMAVGSPWGSGSGKVLQRDMLRGAKTAVGLGINKLEHMELLVLFQEGIGVDRISDITCNVLKDYFIRYTQQVCRRHGVPLQRLRVRNAGWDENVGRWTPAACELPVNPFLTGRRPRHVLLTPARFLQEIPTVEPGDFWDYAWTNENEQLRTDMNYDLAKHVPARFMARLARQNPDVAMSYLRSLEADPKPPYDLVSDPGLTRWYERGRDLAASNPLSFAPDRPEEFPDFIEALIRSFSHGLEDSDAWRLLWVGDQPRGEREVQCLFRSAVIHYCRANKIVLSGESNAGRGPVDFKFAANWHAQALVEIKLTNNSSFWNGLREQTVQYLKSEEVQIGYFVAVGFRDKDFEQERLDRVRDVAKQVSDETGKDVRFAIVDARPKDSASKLKSKRPE